MRLRMSETNTIKGVWLEALAICRRYPLATFAPAVVLGAVGEVPTYLIDENHLFDLGLSVVTAYVAYYLYLAYAEGIVRQARQDEGRSDAGGVFGDIVSALPYVPGVFVAALVVIALTSAATLLLVVPGVWLYTRWSLTTPVIREENVGPLAAMRISNGLARGYFWFVFMTATVAYYLEGVLIHAGGWAAGFATGSYTWGEWVGGSITAALVMPLAAFATSLAHASLDTKA